MAVRGCQAALLAGAVSLVLVGCVAQTDPAGNVEGLTARLKAAGHTDTTPGHYEFQYATSPQALGTAFGFQTPTRGPIPAHVPGNGGDRLFGEDVGGLTVGTTYYYRVCGGDGKVNPDVCSNGQRFTTADSPTVTRYSVPTPSAGLARLSAGPDGALWFTEDSANQIGRITTDGKITEYKVPTANAGLEGITAGPDGAVWFTEDSANQIGRISTDGKVSEFPVPTASAGPLRIIAGPDGALWFTENTADKIGRITAHGKVSEFPVPTANAGPYGITVGRDGALWFTENNANKVGRITTSGAITEYSSSCAAAGCHPDEIAAGADGALWFGGSFENGLIWRISTTGTSTQYSAGSLHADTTQVGSGPDGALWFQSIQCVPPTGPCYTGLGRITTQGQFTTFDQQLANQPIDKDDSATSGPDGALWFLNPAANQIGRAG